MRLDKGFPGLGTDVPLTLTVYPFQVATLISLHSPVAVVRHYNY
jgi:hypothetical protein